MQLFTSFSQGDTLISIVYVVHFNYIEYLPSWVNFWMFLDQTLCQKIILVFTCGIIAFVIEYLHIHNPKLWYEACTWSLYGCRSPKQRHGRPLHGHHLAFPAWTCSKTQEAWAEDPEKWRNGPIPQTSAWESNPGEPKWSLLYRKPKFNINRNQRVQFVSFICHCTVLYKVFTKRFLTKKKV